MREVRIAPWSAGVCLWIVAFVVAGCGGERSEPSSQAATGTNVEVVRDAIEETDGVWVAGLPLKATQRISLAEALEDPTRYAGRPVRMTATIDQVCQVSGCWMIVEDGEQEARVTFADYGFFVPKHAAGAIVEMDVAVERTVMDVETARHLASETEGEDPDAITGPVETIAIVATGVRIVESDR